MIDILTQTFTNEAELDSTLESRLLPTLLSNQTERNEGEKFAEQVWTRAMRSDIGQPEQRSD